jgi:tetratricopeptide (TPR) repeat protein
MPIAIPPLREEMRSLIDSLDAARMDSLAADACGMLGELHQRTNAWGAAESWGQRSVELARRGGIRTLEADGLLNLGVLPGLQGDYEGTVERMTELIPIYERMGHLRNHGICWANIAYSYLCLGRIPEALAANGAALTLARGARNSFGASSALSTRSQLLRLTGRLPEALAYSDSAITIAREAGWALALGTALLARADALHELGRLEEALVVLDEAIEARLRDGNVTYLPQVIHSKAQILLELGRPSACLDLVEEWLPRLESQGDATNLFSALTLRGQALLELGRADEAESVLAEALERFEDYRGRQHDEESQAGIYRRGGEAYAALARCQLARGDARAAWKTAERGRAAVLRRLLEADSVGVSERSDPYARHPLELPALQSALRSTQAALIQYTDPLLNPLVAFVVTADALEAFELGPLDVALDDARAAVDLIASGATEAEVEPILVRLAGKLVTPLAPFIPAGTVRWIVIPPSALAGFPFEVLPLAADGGGSNRGDEPRGSFLGERYAVSYLPAATVLGRPGDPPATRRGDVLALADPDLRSRDRGREREPAEVPSRIRTLRSTPLPRARREADVVAGRSGTSWVGSEATEGRASSRRAQEAAVLHFATHAVITPLAPERSGLLLAAGPDSGSDGMLTAGEIRSRSYRADLVTLSGCATSAGLTVVGEGTYGLPRSFLLAGARSVVASAWKVEDAAAARFMERFYDGLRAGRPRDVALQEARRGLAREGSPLRDRAAFVLFGIGHEPVSSLAGERSARLTMLRGLVAVLAALVAVTMLVGASRLGDARGRLHRKAPRSS